MRYSGLRTAVALNTASLVSITMVTYMVDSFFHWGKHGPPDVAPAGWCGELLKILVGQ